MYRVTAEVMFRGTATFLTSIQSYLGIARPLVLYLAVKKAMTILAWWEMGPNDSLPPTLQLLMVVLLIYLVYPYVQDYLVIHCKLSRICMRYIYKLNLCSNDLTAL